MKLKIVPLRLTDKSLISSMFINDVFECHILEDVPRTKKVHGKTCIPAGTYKIVITHSPRFNKAMPLLLDVPGYAGVRIHPGNTSEATEGCLLPGSYTNVPDFIGNSRDAYFKLFNKIQHALGIGEQVHITINRPEPALT